MKNRSPVAVLLLGFVTIGFYSWYWAVKTKGEMNKMGEKIPTAWIWLIPIVGPIWWYWKYSEGVEHVTNKELGGVLSFLVLYLLGAIGQAIVQDYFNKLNPQATNAGAAPVQSAPAAPAKPLPIPPTTSTSSPGSSNNSPGPKIGSM